MPNVICMHAVKQYYGITWNLNILTLTTTENMTTPFKMEYQIPKIICFILVIFKHCHHSLLHNNMIIIAYQYIVCIYVITGQYDKSSTELIKYLPMSSARAALGRR